MPIPSEKDWGNYQADLDQQYAHKLFFGKNLEQALALFKPWSIIGRAEDLQFMPAIPFRYYIFAYCQYVSSADALGDTQSSDVASCFLRLIKGRLEDDYASIAPIMPQLLTTIEYVANNQALFAADQDIYGDFAEILQSIRHLAGI